MFTYQVFHENLLKEPFWRSHRPGEHLFFGILNARHSRTIQPMLEAVAPTVANSKEVNDYMLSVEDLRLFRDLLNAWLDERLDTLTVAEPGLDCTFEIRGKLYDLDIRRNRHEALMEGIQEMAEMMEDCIQAGKPLYYSVREGYGRCYDGPSP